ncbi:MAG: hypothetical protein JNG90_06400 [Planctomycetaceae bacterium]|nr:hypothetical protein [Planctomycetaceae bacterium]
MHFEICSQLRVTRRQAWDWATSTQGILREMRPWLRMTFPPGSDRLEGAELALGRPLFLSRLYLFGCIPWGTSALTLLAWNAEHGFVEQSPMSGMALWRHERLIADSADGCTLTDRLTFEPRYLRRLTGWFVRRLFAHRHAVLRRSLGAAAG